MSSPATPAGSPADGTPAPGAASLTFETPADDPQVVDHVARQEKKARQAFTWYRVMAFITGTMLLILTAEMILKYVFQVNGVVEEGNIWSARPVLGTWVAIVHGWIYVAYALTVFNLWSTMRWSFGRLVALIAAGVVPVLSFVLERRTHDWFAQSLPAYLERSRALARRRMDLNMAAYRRKGA